MTWHTPPPRWAMGPIWGLTTKSKRGFSAFVVSPGRRDLKPHLKSNWRGQFYQGLAIVVTASCGPQASPEHVEFIHRFLNGFDLSLDGSICSYTA